MSPRDEKDEDEVLPDELDDIDELDDDEDIDEDDDDDEDDEDYDDEDDDEDDDEIEARPEKVSALTESLSKYDNDHLDVLVMIVENFNDDDPTYYLDDYYDDDRSEPDPNAAESPMQAFVELREALQAAKAKKRNESKPASTPGFAGLDECGGSVAGGRARE